MENFLITFGNMSFQAAIVICTVLLVRFLFEKMNVSKKYTKILWLMPFFCMICPWKFESSFGLFTESAEPLKREQLQSVAEYISRAGIETTGDNQINGTIGINDTIGTTGKITGEMSLQSTAEAIQSAATITTVLFAIWLCGVAALSLYAVITYYKMKRKLLCSVRIEDTIYLADDIPSPFVFGMIKPKIYLPSHMNEREQKYVIAHEKMHIHMKDSPVKMAAFFITAIHWFNPFAWVAFTYLGKDIEMYCDEKVISEMGEESRKEYAAALLDLTVGKRRILGTPLAFGEGSTKGRIKSIMKHKKPLVAAVVIAILLIVVLAVVFFTKNANQENANANTNTVEEGQGEEVSANQEQPGTYMDEIERNKDAIIEELAKITNDFEAIQETDSYVVVHGRRQSGWEYFESFYQSVQAGEAAAVKVIQFTAEGDAIISNLQYDGTDFYILDDNSRDEFWGGEEYSEETYPYLKVFEGVLENGDEYTACYLTNDDTMSMEDFSKKLMQEREEWGEGLQIREVFYEIHDNANSKIGSQTATNDVETTFDESAVLKKEEDITTCEIVKGDTGEVISTSVLDSSNGYRDIMEKYQALDFQPDTEMEFRVGYSYSLILRDAEGNQIQRVTPYNDAVIIDGEIYRCDMNSTASDLLLELSSIFEQK